jgi:hypothetical protein
MGRWGDQGLSIKIEKSKTLTAIAREWVKAALSFEDSLKNYRL